MENKIDLTDRDLEIHGQRASRYGDATEGHRNLGMLWRGILNQYFQGRGYKISLPEIPASIVEMMFAASKISRAARERKNPDDENYIDCRVYMELARQAERIEKHKVMAFKKLRFVGGAK